MPDESRREGAREASTRVPRDAVGAVVVHADGRVLLIRRGRPPLEGAWTLPGGKVEPDESWAEAVVRELREETGLAVRVERYLETFHLAAESFRFAIHEHLCRPVSPGAGVPVAGDDAADARWARLDELEALGVSEEARALILRALERDAPVHARG